MELKLALWTRAGACLLAGTAAVIAAPDLAARPDGGADAASDARAARWPGGEGGEGGEGGSALSRYRLMLDAQSDPQYDGMALARNYARDVQRAYADAADGARRLQRAVDQLLDAPSSSNLDLARAAWTSARQPYLATEAFRFYEGPIDGPQTAQSAAGPEPRLNAWPVNEAVIDAVEGQPEAGLVHDYDTRIDRDTVLALDQVSDEADVTTGWHAIEFLLWGQDRSDQGPGARPHTDFEPGIPANDRRRAYLALLVQMLVQDMDWLHEQWNSQREQSYARSFLALEPHEAVGRMLAGAATLAGHELASERLAVALDSGVQEDEQSCFSDTTRQDFIWGLVGLKRVYYGRGPGESIARTVARLQPRLALEMERRFADAERRVAALQQPFDAILRAPDESPARVDAEAAVAALQSLAAGLRDVGRALGVLVIVPGV